MPGPEFPLDEAYLIGGWLESGLWGKITFLAVEGFLIDLAMTGFYTLLFAITMYPILKHRRWKLRKFTTISLIFQYILATTHMMIALVRLLNGFIRYRDTVGPVQYLANIALPVNVAKDWIYITNLFLGDLVVVWRLYVVWGKTRWVSVFPLLMVVAELVAGYGALAQWFLKHPVLTTTVNWGTAMFTMSMVTNSIVTGAIAGRIWYITTRGRAAGFPLQSSTQYTRLILLLVESGALMTAAKIVEFVLFKLDAGEGRPGLNTMYIVYESIPQITGIVPTVIIHAVNSGFTDQDGYFATTRKSSVVFAKDSVISTVNVGDASADPQSQQQVSRQTHSPL